MSSLTLLSCHLGGVLASAEEDRQSLLACTNPESWPLALSPEVYYYLLRS